MPNEIGELLVGAYLKVITGCELVSYNVRPLGGGQHEIDVIGLHFNPMTAYLCEVSTHLSGLLYGNGNAATLQRIRQKVEYMNRYASKNLPTTFQHTVMFWAPYVPQGALTAGLQALADELGFLDLVINGTYATWINSLLVEAAQQPPAATENDAFRLLQLLQHLRNDGGDRVGPLIFPPQT